MKKIILIFFTILFFSTLINAQNVGIGSSSFTPLNMLDVKGTMVIGTGFAGINTAPADGLLIQGNVGIGITSPSTKFQVGPGTSNTFSPVAMLGADGGNAILHAISLVNSRAGALGNGVAIDFHNGSSWSPTGQISVVQAGAAVTDAEMRFLTYNGGLSQRMVINYLGNVGIGTASPGFRLDVNGIVRIPSGNYYSFENWQWAMGKDISTQFSTNEELQILGYGSGGNSFQIIGVSGVSPTYTYSRILQANFDNGRVGIGASPTNSLLEVNGGIRVLTSASADLYGSGLVLNDESNASLWHQIHIHGNRIRAYDGSTEDIYVTTTDLNSSYISGTLNYVAKFTSANSIGNSQIFDNGTNVGIGTAAPAKKLEVNGDIYNRGILFQKTSDGQGSGAHGISWYDPSFFTWFDYMAPAGGTNSPSVTAAPTDAASGVTSWARRFNIENVAGYGWLFESGANASGSAPTVKFAINSNNGNFHSVGNAIVDGTVRAGAYAILGTNISAGYYQDATNGAYRAIVGSGTTNGYYFQTNTGAATTMYVGLGGTYNGKVGIGTTTPGFSLHVPSGYIGTDYINTTDNSIGSGVTGVMVKAGDNYHRTATSAALATFLGNYGNWIPNNGIGDWQIASSSTGTSYSEASLELRESNFTGNGSATPPRLGFHWGGIVASQIGIESSGRIAILNNPGSGYENLVANNIYSAGNVYVGSYGGINSVPTTYGSLGLLQTKGGYYGLLFGQSTSNPNLMYDGAGNGGIYYENYGWLYYTLASNKNTGWGTTGPAYKMHVIGDIFADGGWLRTSGNAGWYSESYGGGWYMTDGTWIRSYNGKNILCDQTTQTRYLNWGENTANSHSAYFSGFSEAWSVSDGHRFNPMNYDYGATGWGYIGQPNRDWYYMYADYFTNTSDRKKKKDIVPLNTELYELVMQDIDKIKPSFYRYKGETTDWIDGYETKYKPQLTLGIMLDESPDYIQDNAFSGINIYSAAVLALAGVKYNREDINKIKSEIINLQDFGNGTVQTWIPFSREFSQNLNGEIPNITITPTSPNNGFYVSKVNNQGFMVEGNQPFTFNWLALAKTTKPLETKNNSNQIDQTLINQLRISQNIKDKVQQYWNNVNQKSMDEYNTNLEGLKKTQPKAYQSIIDENLKNLNYLNQYSK